MRDDVTIHREVEQGSDEWLALRCGMLTASEMHHIITPSGKPAKNEKMRAHAYDLLAQRLTGYVDPRYVSDEMLRGKTDEIEARWLYEEKYGPVEQVGFIVRQIGDRKIGYSPDGLVGEDGQIECKGRLPKIQIETILDGGPPRNAMIQVQTGLLVTGREWCDYVSYSGGMPMAVYRIPPDERLQDAILEAAYQFEAFIAGAEVMFRNQVDVRRFHPTERRVEQEMVL